MLPRLGAAFPWGGFGARTRWSGARAVLTLGLLALLGLALWRFGDRESLVAARAGLRQRPELLVIFVTTYTGAFLLRAVVWRWLLPGGPAAPRLFLLLQIALLANHVFPTKAGELIRVALLVRRGVPVGAATASTALARLLDFVVVIGLALVVGPWVGGRLDMLLVGLAAPILVALVGGALLALLVMGRLNGLGRRLPGRAARLLTNARAALTEVTRKRLLAALVLVVPSWLLEAGVIWSVAQAAGVATVTPAAAVVATAFTIAFQGFQFTPGGIGVYEASLTGILTVLGVEPATALSLAITTHALKFLYAYLVGLPSLALEGLDGLRLGGSPNSPAPFRFVKGAPLGRVESGNQTELTTNCSLQDTPFPSGKRARGLGLNLSFGAALLLVAVWMGVNPERWGALAIGALATLPLVGLAGTHYLPGVRVPSPVWVLVFAPALLAATFQPLAVAILSIAAWVGIVGLRQWLLARRPLPPPGPPNGRTVVVVLPAHNEAQDVGAVITGVPRSVFAAHGYETQVIVVDDGSTDGTAAIALAAGADRIVAHARRQGLGAALRSGLTAAREYDVAAVVYLDADGEYFPADLPAVAAPILRGEADYVLGNRFPAAAKVMVPSRRIGNRLFTAFVSALAAHRLADAQTGSRAFSARAMAAAEIIHDYNYAQVLTLDLLRKRFRFVEQPIHYQRRRNGVSFIRYRAYLRHVLPAIARELLSP